jgi:hypothetical protein
MKKRSIILISTIILNSINGYADDNSTLPALPSSSKIIDTQTHSEEKTEEKNLWGKKKSFFGFANKKEEVKVEETVAIIPIRPPSELERAIVLLHF